VLAVALAAVAAFAPEEYVDILSGTYSRYDLRCGEEAAAPLSCVLSHSGDAWRCQRAARQ
jgi:hypothetical protein